MESLEELQERRRFEDELGYAENLLEQQAQYETQANLQPSAVGAAGPDFDQAAHDQAAAFQAQYQPEVGPAFIPGATEEAEAALQDARASAPIWSPDFDSGIGGYETPLAGLEGLKEATAPLAQGVVDTTVGTLAGADWLLGKALGQEGNVLGIDKVDDFWHKHNPQSDNGASHAARQIAGVVIPAILLPNTIIPKVAALPAVTNLPRAAKTFGALAARLGIDTAVVGSSTSSHDENAAKAANDAWGWNLPWATREGAGPDERFKAQLYENMGFAVGAELLSAIPAARALFLGWRASKGLKYADGQSWLHKFDQTRRYLTDGGEVGPGTIIEWDPGLTVSPRTPEAAEAVVRSADNIAQQTVSPAIKEIDEQINQLGLLDELGEAEELRLAELVVERKKIEVDEAAFDPITRNLNEAENARTNALADEAAEVAAKNQGEYDPIIHEPAEAQARGQAISGPADPLGAGYDYVRILNDLNTTRGRARAVLPTSGMRKLLNAPEGSVRAELLENLTSAFEAHRGMDAVIEGTWKVSPEEWKAAVNEKVKEIHSLDPEVMRDTLEELNYKALKGAEFLSTEDFLVYSEAVKEVINTMNPDQLRASAMIVQQAADSAQSAAGAKTILSEVLETSRQTENMLTNLAAVMKETRAVRYLWGYTGNLLDMTKGKRLDAAKLKEIVDGFDEGYAKAHKEANSFVEEMRRVAVEEPELFQAFTKAYDMSDGNITDINKLNRWAEQAVGVFGKVLVDRTPAVKSLVVQGLHGLRYNSYLNGLAPVRAAVGNSILTINKPISVLAGSAYQSIGEFASTGNVTSSAAIVKRAMYTYGGIYENFQRAFKHMAKEWNFAVANPEQAMLRTRADIKFANSDQLDVLENMAEKWRKEGKYGRLGALFMARSTSWLNNLAVNRWGVNALTAIDGFTNSMMASGFARARAYDELFEKTGGVVDGSFKTNFQATQQKLYDSAFDSTGLLKDEAAKHASREIALNLDSETAKRLDDLIDLAPGLKPLFMFPRTGINGFKVAWSYNPLSALPDAIGRGNKVFSAATEADVLDVLRSHGINDFSDPMMALQTLKNEYRGRQIMGSAIVMGVGMMAWNGDLTGNGPFDAAEKRDMMDLKWKPLSIRINGNWYSYKGFEPYQQTLSLIADIMYNANRVDSAITEDLLEKVGYALTMNVSNQTFLSGLAPLAGLIGRDERTINRFLAGWTDPLVPFYWTGTRSVLNKIITPQLKDVENEMNSFHKNFSKFLYSGNEELKDQLDIFTGERINYTDGPTKWMNAFLPFFKSNGGTEPWRQWLLGTGWNNMQSLRVNKLSGRPLEPDERYFINNWIAQNAGLKEQVERLMEIDKKGKYTQRYVNKRGQRKQKDLPISDTYIHEQLDKMIDNAFKHAWEALEAENASYGSMGVLERYQKEALERGDMEGATQYSDQIQGYLKDRQPLN